MDIKLQYFVYDFVVCSGAMRCAVTVLLNVFTS